MKKTISLIAVLLPFLSLGQQMEIGLGVGLSANSKPNGNLIYKGGVISPNYAVNLVLLKNLQNNWQFGADIHVLEMSRIAEKDYPGYYDNSNLGGKGKLFVYGEETSSLALILNKKFSSGSHYFYLGGVLGANFVLNFKSQSISTHPNPNDIYYKSPSGGYGGVGGLHLGYTTNISKRVVFNAELAALAYYVTFRNNAPPDYKSNLHYTILAYPFTIGIHYRFGKGINISDNPTQIQKYEKLLSEQQTIMNKVLVRDSIILGRLLTDHNRNYEKMAERDSLILEYLQRSNTVINNGATQYPEGNETKHGQTVNYVDRVIVVPVNNVPANNKKKQRHHGVQNFFNRIFSKIP